MLMRKAHGEVSHYERTFGTRKRGLPESARRVGENINRGIDLLSPVWNILDLTPGGRGDWNAKLDYD